MPPSGPDKQPSDLDEAVAKAAKKIGKFGTPLTTAKAGMARDLMVSLAAGYAHELLQRKQPQEGAAWLEFSVELSGVTVAEEMTGMSADDRRAYADQLLEVGCFDLARQAFAFLMEHGERDYEVAKTLSALQFKLGEPTQARATLEHHFTHHPCYLQAASTDDETAPTILRTQGYDQSVFNVAMKKGHETYAVYRRGGHFSLRYLFDHKPFHMQHYTVCKDNILTDKTVPDHALILNTIADADTEAASLRTLARYLEGRDDVPVINHPARVLETTRDNNHRRLNALGGIVFPRTERLPVTAADSAAATAARINALGFDFPFIIRRTGTHTAVSTALVHSDAELMQYLENAGATTLYLIEFHENASDAGHYSKLRFFAIDGALYPVVYHTDRVWNVHGGNRKTFMASHDWMLEREQRFLADPAAVIGTAVYDRLAALPKIIGLEFFGFDFTLLPDGDVLIFELNPAMRHSLDHAQNFAYLTPYMEAITNAFQRMVERRLTP